MAKELESDFAEEEKRLLKNLWAKFLLFVGAIEIFLCPVVGAWNDFRLRCPFLKKKRCWVKILNKKPAIYISSKKQSAGIPRKIFLVFFSFNEKRVSTEIDEETFDRMRIGNKIEIEYVEGRDRLHARVLKF